MTVYAANTIQATWCLFEAASTSSEAERSLAPAMRRSRGKVPASISCCSSQPPHLSCSCLSKLGVARPAAVVAKGREEGKSAGEQLLT